MPKQMRTDDNVSSLSEALAAIREQDKTEGSEAAEKSLIALISENPDARKAYTALARVLMKQKKFDYAARAANRAAELAPMEAAPTVLAGFARMRAGDREGAAAAFGDALKIDATSARATLGAALLKLADESYDDALELCERAFALDSSMEKAHQLIVRINLKMGNKTEALQELKSLLDSDGGGKKALRTYARLMRDEGRLDEAIAEAAKGASKGSKSMSRFAQLASMSGKPELAVDEYRNLIARGEASESDNVRFVTVLVSCGALNDARTAMEGLSDRKLLKPVKHKLKGDISLAEGDFGAAVMQFRKACKAAGIDGPEEGGLASDASPEETAKHWAKYTSQGVRTALRDRRKGGGNKAS